jgi:hypothetical protein
MSDNLPREVVEANEHLLRDAQRWQAFPTDEDVRRAAASECGTNSPCPKHLRLARAFLEAVKREERSKMNPATEKAVEVMRTNLEAVKREDSA